MTHATRTRARGAYLIRYTLYGIRYNPYTRSLPAFGLHSFRVLMPADPLRPGRLRVSKLRNGRSPTSAAAPPTPPQAAEIAALRGKLGDFERRWASDPAFIFYTLYSTTQPAPPCISLCTAPRADARPRCRTPLKSLLGSMRSLDACVTSIVSVQQQTALLPQM